MTGESHRRLLEALEKQAGDYLRGDV